MQQQHVISSTVRIEPLIRSMMSFPLGGRRCCSCRRLGTPSEFLRCSRCKVFVYCDQDCQKSHWKNAHKKCCQPLLKTPPLYSTLPHKPDDETDLDVRYKYILVFPGVERPSYGAFLATARGINSDEELDTLLEDPNATISSVNSVLSDRYRWPSGPSVSQVPGFRDQYDGCLLRCVADASFQTCPNLSQNIAAGYIMMMPLVKARGIFVFSALDVTNCDSLDDRGKPMCITRREILSISNYHSTCGIEDCLSERNHFENICRKEALLLLKKEQFVTLPPSALSLEEDDK